MASGYSVFDNTPCRYTLWGEVEYVREMYKRVGEAEEKAQNIWNQSKAVKKYKAQVIISVLLIYIWMLL